MTALLKSRKFLLLVLDVVGSTSLFFAAKYAGPAYDDIKYVIIGFQPIFFEVIRSITKEDVAKTEAAALLATAA